MKVRRKGEEGDGVYDEVTHAAYMTGEGHESIHRTRPKPGFRPNPIGFGADMNTHPKYDKKTPRKR